jgi:hypothetical protein
MTANAAPPATTAAGQNHTAPRNGRLPTTVPAVEAFEPRARLATASPGLDAGVGRRGSSVLAGRTCFEGDVTTDPRTGRATWSVAAA